MSYRHLSADQLVELLEQRDEDLAALRSINRKAANALSAAEAKISVMSSELGRLTETLAKTQESLAAAEGQLRELDGGLEESGRANTALCSTVEELQGALEDAVVHRMGCFPFIGLRVEAAAAAAAAPAAAESGRGAPSEREGARGIPAAGAATAAAYAPSSSSFTQSRSGSTAGPRAGRSGGGGSSGGGLRVLDAKGPAQLAGVRPGDVVVAARTEKTYDLQTLANFECLLFELVPECTVTLDVETGGAGDRVSVLLKPALLRSAPPPSHSPALLRGGSAVQARGASHELR